MHVNLIDMIVNIINAIWSIGSCMRTVALSLYASNNFILVSVSAVTYVFHEYSFHIYAGANELFQYQLKDRSSDELIKTSVLGKYDTVIKVVEK